MYEIGTIIDEKLSHRKVKHVIRGDKVAVRVRACYLAPGSGILTTVFVYTHTETQTLLC